MIVPQERLAEIFDEIIRDITQREAGICLHAQASPPEGELCTVFATFEHGYHTSLSLCAEMSIFRRLTQHMMEMEEVSPQDVEDFAKEYFNVLCGHIVSRLFQLTKVPARFGVPSFYHGRYVPEDQLKHIVLTYSSEQNETAQLIHHAPVDLCEDPLYETEIKKESAL